MHARADAPRMTESQDKLSRTRERGHETDSSLREAGLLAPQMPVAGSPRDVAARLAAHSDPQARSMARRSLLALQRQYGNRYVQRALALARQGDGPAEAGPEVEEGVRQAQGRGQALDRNVQAQMGEALGADFGGVQVHTDRRADELNQAVSARAFTVGQNIFFREGEYAPGTSSGRELLAHELTHVVQQGAGSAAPAPQGKLTVGAAGDQYEQEADRTAHQVMRLEAEAGPNRLQRQAAPAAVAQPGSASAAPAGGAAPGPIDLKGQTEVPAALLDPIFAALPKKKSSTSVTARFGNLAEGPLDVQKTREGYKIKKRMLPLKKHPLFPIAQDLPIGLVVYTGKNGAIEGYLGTEHGDMKGLARTVREAPELIGLSGFKIPEPPAIPNKLEAGKLVIGPATIAVRFGKALSGSVTMSATDDQLGEVTGKVSAQVKGLASGEVNLTRSEAGVVTGDGEIDLDLPKNFSGKAKVAWNGETVSGEAKVGYQGEKLSGEVVLKIMDAAEAKQLEAEKKAPTTQAPAAAKKQAKKAEENKSFAVFGEGDLKFAFTDWLAGSAHVIVDPQGYVTIIGEIKPQAEVELFPQKDYSKDLFSKEVRASYGLPVVGNIFIFAKVELDAFAKLGPAKLYNIAIDGTYSTDPKKAREWSLRGSFNIGAAAGLRLRGEAGAGIEILSHDIKAGAGVNGIAAVRGYAEATPIIGYREKQGAEGEDKKGEFFIRGEMELAAQPFLGLSGDLFIELSTPWWSPLSDKKWTWDLGSMEWPLSSTIGIGANVDYVLGSDQLPSIDFKSVEFDSEKFFTDLYNDKAQASGQAAAEKAGKWKEQNQKDAEPPTAAPQGNAQPGEPKEAAPAQPTATKAEGEKPQGPADPQAQTAEGKTVQQLQDEAKAKGGKPDGKEPESKQAEGKPAEGKTGEPATPKPAGAPEAATPEKWQRGVGVVKQALAYADKTGISEKELNRILDKIKRRSEYGFTQLYAKASGTAWEVYGAMSPPQLIATVPVVAEDAPQLTDNNDVRNLVFKLPVGKRHHRALYSQLARDKQLFSDPNYARDTDQRTKWINEIAIPPEVRRAWAAEFGLRNDVEAVIPTWNETGRGMPFEVDHVQEMQLGGVDTLENYELLDRTSNGSAGPTINNFITNLRAELAQRFGVTPRILVFDRGVVVQGGNGSGEHWTREQIEQGEHIDVLRQERRSAE